MAKTWGNEAYLLYKQGHTWDSVVTTLQKKGLLDGDKPTRALKESVRKTVLYIRKKNGEVMSPKPNTNVPLPHSTEWKSNGEYISSKVIEICNNETDITPERIMQLHDLNPFQWEVISYKNNYWQTQQKGGVVMDLYQSKLVVKPKEVAINPEKVKLFFEELDRKYVDGPEDIQADDRSSNRMLEVNISDLHIGKYYYDDVNNIRYDTLYTKNLWKDLISKIKEKISGHHYSYIQFIWCNDFFNSDGMRKTTTSGIPQDTDLDWQELFNVGLSLLIEMIENLKIINPNRKTPIKIIYTPSNHDHQVSWYAVKFLEAWFKDDVYVSVDSSKYPRKYIKFGNTLIGYSHGDTKTHPKNVASLMPLESPDLWSNTQFREFHLAHLHSEHMIQEINGVIVRRCSTVTFPDLYHIENGYVGNERKVQLFVYDEISGLDTIYNIRA